MLIKCPECGKEISDTIPACIHCGFVINNSTPNNNIDNTVKHDVSTNETQVTNSMNSVSLYSNPNATISDNGISSVAKKPNRNKRIIISSIAVTVIAIAILVIIAILHSPITFNSVEKVAYNSVISYRNSMKDPESLLIRGDILYIKTNSGEYIYFDASGNNSYGAKTRSIPMMKNGRFLADYDDWKSSYDSEDNQNKKMDVLDGSSVYLMWSLKGRDLVDGDVYLDVQKIDGEKIARVVGCSYSKE